METIKKIINKLKNKFAWRPQVKYPSSKLRLQTMKGKKWKDTKLWKA